MGRRAHWGRRDRRRRPAPRRSWPGRSAGSRAATGGYHLVRDGRLRPDRHGGAPRRAGPGGLPRHDVPVPGDLRAARPHGGALSPPPVREPGHHAHARGPGRAVRPRALAARPRPRAARSERSSRCGAALAGVDVWVTGLMRSQGGERSALRERQWDDAYQLVQVNPLAGWDRRAGLGLRARPRRALQRAARARLSHARLHPLHRGGARAQARASTAARGRWAGTDKTECGLHFDAPRQLARKA